MSITYDLIIKHLCPNKDIKVTDKTFSTQKNIYGFSKTFPSVFHEFICDKTYRYGVTCFNNNENISLWSSLLTLLCSVVDETEQIAQFKRDLLDKYPTQYHINKIDLREKFKIIPDINILQYIVDVLDINFIIFNFKTEQINLVYKNNIMNPMKPIFLFANYDELWEPVLINDNIPQKQFSYHNIFIKKILSSTLYYYDNIRTVIINDNINVVIENEQMHLKTKESKVVTQKIITRSHSKEPARFKQDPQIIVKVNNVKPVPQEEKKETLFIKYDVLSLNKLSKMTKDKLIEHAKLIGVSLQMDKLVKAKIIEHIMNHTIV